MIRGRSANARLGPPAQEDAPIDLDAPVLANIGLIVAGLVIVVVFLVIAVVGLVRRTRQLSRRIEGMTGGADGASLEGVVSAALERARQAVKDVDVVAARTAVLERDITTSFSRVGLVRFNPFEDTGGNQSFALALLDGRGDGFVVSSLHARGGTRIYAKAIARGASEAALSTEEAEALRQALARPASGGSA